MNCSTSLALTNCQVIVRKHLSVVLVVLVGAEISIWCDRGDATNREEITARISKAKHHPSLAGGVVLDWRLWLALSTITLEQMQCLQQQGSVTHTLSRKLALATFGQGSLQTTLFL